MAHAQKPDFVFRRNGRVHLNRRGRQSTTGSRVVGISGSNVGYNMFRGSAKGSGYTIHSPLNHSLPLPCVTVCHRVLTGLYNDVNNQQMQQLFRLLPLFNKLRTGDADLHFYITTVQDGWRKSAFLTSACFPCTIHLIMQYIEPVSE